MSEDPAPDADVPAMRRDPAGAPASATRGPPGLPAWYPAWARELADLYFSGTTSVFVLHGNVHDLVRCEGPGEGEATYVDLSEFLATHLFGSWDVVLHYDLGRGLRPLAGSDKKRLQAMVEHTSLFGEPATWPRTPEKVLFLLDHLLNRTLLMEAGAKDRQGRKQASSAAFLFEHAQYVFPDADITALAAVHGSRLVRMLEWAQNPYVKRRNVAFCLITDKLTEVNTRLVQNPYVATVEIPIPTAADRERFARWTTRGEAFERYSDFTPEQLAKVSNGLSLVDLNVIVQQARSGRRRVDRDLFRGMKKDLIERQCHGLLEFFEPSHQLDMVVGHGAAKDRLRGDAEIITSGRLEFAPMGYLICGPVGTGKTFLAECYAGSIGIPCVKLLNFRSKYVGETEGNLEHVLTVLRSLGPVVVIIDEADAALGTREAEGDSGTSARVFSMIASQMGDTRYRGKIVWMLLTSRPDRLPVDLKRQGRAEVHIPLFYPEDAEERRRMFLIMGRKNKVRLSDDAVAGVAADERRLSGSDIESVVLAANLLALRAGREEVLREDLDGALGDFVPSSQGLEREAQELAAVLECTQLSFLPEAWRAKVAKPNGRVAIHERFVAIRQILEE